MISGKLGAEGSYDVGYENGVLKVSIKQSGSDGNANAGFDLKVLDLLKVVAAHSDNKWDDVLVDYLGKLLPSV